MNTDNTLLSAFRQRIDARRIAFLSDGGSSLRYGEFDAWISRIREQLAAGGLIRGARIATLMPRSPLGLALFLAVSADNICCPMNPRLKRAEFDRFFEATEVDALILGEDNHEAASVARARGLVVIEVRHRTDNTLAVRDTERGPAKGEAVDRDGAVRSALLLQTSGTTSNPKLVFLSHSQLLTSINGLCAAFALTEDDICLNPMPFQHAHGLITAGMSSLMSGSRLVCLQSFSAELFDRAFREFRPTWFTGAPAMHLSLLDFYNSGSASPPKGHLRFLRSSSAPLPSSTISRLEALFDAPLIETYGLTETATMITTNPLPPGERKIGSVGLPCSGAQIKIVDEANQIAPVGASGEILVRGPTVISHYGDRPVVDEINFSDSWLRTGDEGYLDQDGYLFITGRLKELIKRGGLSVYPTEVDNLLVALPAVADAATFSIPHESLGEDVVSVVVLTEGASATEQSLRGELFGALSSYKVPTAILIAGSIPKNEAGKVVRRNLSQWFLKNLTPAGIEPRGETETSLLDRWRAVLGREDIGVTDNLFLFGADTLKADRLEQEFKGAQTWRRGAFYRSPTVALQAELITRGAES